MTEDKTAEETALEYGFKWFEFHAQQRITSFNFYLVIYSGLAAAVSFSLKEKLQLGSILISLMMIGVSILFWQLDVRNRQLIKIGESILSDSWQRNGLSEGLNPVALSDAKQAEGFRYKELFGTVFMLGGLVGVCLFAYAVYLTKERWVNARKEVGNRVFSGEITVATLRVEHQRGNLVLFGIGRQYFTTLKCHDGEIPHTGTAASSKTWSGVGWKAQGSIGRSDICKDESYPTHEEKKSADGTA
jgi:hypothetical protein